MKVHASTGEIPFAFVSPGRLQLIGMERTPRLRQAEERTEDASTAAKEYVEDLKALIPVVRRQLGKAQATYKRKFDARTKGKNNTVKAGDGVYLDAHSRSPKKLGCKPKDPTWYYKSMGIGLCWRALGVSAHCAVTKSLVTTGVGCEMDPGPYGPSPL